MTQTTKTQYGNYAVSIIPNCDRFMACALLCDGASYGGDSYWFTIGHYANVKNAQRAAVRQMAKYGCTIEFN